MSKITVTTIAGLTSGGDANTVKIESGDAFNVVSGDLTVDTNVLKVDSSNNRVGIGTASPSYTLHSTTSSGSDFAGFFHNSSGSGNGTALVAKGGANNSGAGTFIVQDYGGNEDFKVDGLGRVTMANQPRFFAYQSNRFPSSGNISGGTIFQFNNTNLNVGNGYSTSNHRFTAPVAGTYVFGTHLRYANTGGTRVLRIMLRKNGSQQWDLASVGGTETPYTTSAGDHPGIAGTTIIAASASDYFDLEISTEIDTSGNSYFDSGLRTNFWGYLLA